MSSQHTLASREKQQLIVEWNNTKIPCFQNKCIHELVEEQVTKIPHSPAVIYEDEILTYQQLNERANQLAYQLRKLAVREDSLIPIAIDRSIEMIVGILAILKAGGAYVPIDPDYPEERCHFILEDICAPHLLTHSSLKDKFSRYQGKILCLDSPELDRDQEASLNPKVATSPYHLAYVIYTSGSTGKPKGVMIEHRSLCNRLLWMQKELGLSYQDRVLQKTPFTFDVSVWEFFWPLITGATLVMANPQSHKDPDSLIKQIKKYNVTVCHFVPSMLDHFLDIAENHEDFPLRFLITSGEALSSELAQKHYSVLSANLLNLYGPTEAAIDVTYHHVEKGDLTLIPIGRPISNTHIYILDSEMEPVPIGQEGEIYISGIGLARGYLNRPDLTAENFFPNPFLQPEDREKGTHLRLYRTGDIGRYQTNGNIEFLGRIDDQIKIRGFRVELGEIESALRTHENVLQAVVLIEEDDFYRKKLIAYIVPQESLLRSMARREGQEFSIYQEERASLFIDRLEAHLSLTLPEYTVPSFFVFIDQIPLTLNGKIDRKALLRARLGEITNEIYAAPQTSLEKELSLIFADSLKLKQVGIHDNFFRIGGDSILSIQIVSRARKKGIYFTTKDIFENPTIASLSKVAANQTSRTSYDPDQGVLEGDAPLTQIQRWFFNQNFREENDFSQAVLLIPCENLDIQLLNQAFSSLIHHHDVFRLRFSKDKEQVWKQEYIESGEEPVCKVVDLSKGCEETLEEEIDLECKKIQGNLDIKSGSLIKALLFNCGDQRGQRLFILIHHLIIDGISWRILAEDLEKIYDSLINQEPLELPAKTHAYTEWAKAINEYALSQKIKDEIPYWRDIESKIKPISDDLTQKADSSCTISRLTRSLTQAETTQLLHQAPKAYHTEINDILLTALTLAMADCSKNYSLTIYLEGHGREDIGVNLDISRTIGWFTSIFPVHLEIKDRDNLDVAIKTVKEILRNIPNKGIGYGVLAYLGNQSALSPSSHRPALSFNYLGQWDNNLSEAGLFTFAPEFLEKPVSSFHNPLCALDLTGEVKEGILKLYWRYSKNHYNPSTIEKIASIYIERLRQLIEHCFQKDTLGYTPSDFKLAKLETGDLERKLKILSDLKVI